jgi:2-polyprenyl-6-methoxyphenol hydroxylase-like FAD-dependent oxidoreductase
MAGVGANIALWDAEVLTDVLSKASRGEVELLDAIRAYEDQMRVYANAAVVLSKQIAQGASSESVVGRWMFHAILRLAHASPWVMKNMVGRGAVAVGE